MLMRNVDEVGEEMLDVLGDLGQVNKHFTALNEFQRFREVAMSVVRELNGFSRVIINQFDKRWNRQMSHEPLAVRCLENKGVPAFMRIFISVLDQLKSLTVLHSYGPKGEHVLFSCTGSAVSWASRRCATSTV
ncbi:hypothetical protein FA10DRAFT_291734 [Acaromyces ingoldii]|uniref:Uncharacterized protein n=1 Tax=Acaromyces ingoldii TaxID=215250 RepID=A0A316YBH9_9BASI|nr:hypothetical protein FA10DRAFT_291734 [Acaromyces ingoldii]PWN86672.1 hypothetical protein FA10DRAFT_291734 [Acaromyces ingoldii]